MSTQEHTKPKQSRRTKQPPLSELLQGLEPASCEPDNRRKKEEIKRLNEELDWDE